MATGATAISTASTADFRLDFQVDETSAGLSHSFVYDLRSSEALPRVQQVAVTTVAGTAESLGYERNSRFMILTPLNAVANFRITGSTAEEGLLISSGTICVLSITSNTVVHAYTTGGTTFVIRKVTF